MAVLQTRADIIESLFKEYGNAIYRYVRYTLPGEADTADIVQDVFMRAFHAWNEFEGRSEPKTWLFKIARNCTYDLLRKRQSEVHRARKRLQAMLDESLTGDALQTDRPEGGAKR